MNETEVVKLYTKQNKSTYEIAELFKTYPNKIRRVLIKHGVSLKDKSQAQKNALKSGAAKIPTEGKKRSKEEKLKISSSLKKRWDNLDENTYQKYVNMARQRWNNMSIEDKEAMKHSGMKAIRDASKNGSKLERYIEYELSASGYTVLIHQKNILPNRYLEVDLYLPNLKTIIEVDGPSHFLPIWGEERLHKQIKADQDKTGLILSKGFVILRVKHVKDSLALATKEDLKNKILGILRDIESKFPEESKRYIEIEV
jgi:very-short-patch-repair endonuclease